MHLLRGGHRDHLCRVREELMVQLRLCLVVEADHPVHLAPQAVQLAGLDQGGRSVAPSQVALSPEVLSAVPCLTDLRAAPQI